MKSNINSQPANNIKENNIVASKYISDFSSVQIIYNMYSLNTIQKSHDFYDAVLSKLEAYLLWYYQVASQKPWDLKAIGLLKKSDEYLYDAISKCSYRRDIWGNVHYGYIGKAVGFSDFELTNGAGAAQVKTMIIVLTDYDDSGPIKDGLKRLLSSPLDFLGAFDPPDDAAAVRLGIDLWNTYQDNLEVDDFLSSLRNRKHILPTK